MRFARKAFFFVVFVSGLVDARERGRRGCGTGSAAEWGAEWALHGEGALPRGVSCFFFPLALCFSFLFRCSSMSLNAHRIPSWRTEETACIGRAAYTKAITHGLLQMGNAQNQPPWKFLKLDLYHPSPPTCPIQRCPTTTQVQGSSRPAALKSQAAQPPAVTQGPGNHRLETWTVDQGGRSSLGEPRELPCQVCAVGQRCVSPICLFLCAVDTTCGRMVLALFAGPTKG